MCITLKPVPTVLPRSMVALVLGLFTCTCGHQDSPFHGEKKDIETLIESHFQSLSFDIATELLSWHIIFYVLNSFMHGLSHRPMPIIMYNFACLLRRLCSQMHSSSSHGHV